MSKGFKYLLVVFILALFCVAVKVIAGSASVQTRTQYIKEFKFNLLPGQRVIVVDENTTQVRVYPPDSRVFDYKVPDGKELSGILKEKDK